MTDAEKLLPCPFCGDTPNALSHYVSQGTKWGGIECDVCLARGPEVRTGYGDWGEWKDAAIAEWNRREKGDG